jgi:hypothetical protein
VLLWVLLDVAVGLLAVVVLVLAGLRLYRHVKALGRAVSATSESLGEASAGLSIERPSSR